MLANVCGSAVYEGTKTGQLHCKYRENDQLTMMCIESNTQIQVINGSILIYEIRHPCILKLL